MNGGSSGKRKRNFSSGPEKRSRCSALMLRFLITRIQYWRNIRGVEEELPSPILGHRMLGFQVLRVRDFRVSGEGSQTRVRGFAFEGLRSRVRKPGFEGLGSEAPNVFQSARPL